MGDDGAANHLADMGAMERELLDQAAERGGEHVEIGELGIGRMGAAKRDPDPAEHRDAPHLLVPHDRLPSP